MKLDSLTLLSTSGLDCRYPTFSVHAVHSIPTSPPAQFRHRREIVTQNFRKQPTPRSELESLLYMQTRKQFSALVLGAALACSPALGWSQTTTDSGAKQSMKDAGHESKNAAKDAGHGVKQGTKKSYHATKKGTKKAWNKTKSTTKGAVDGGKEGAKQPQ